MGAASRCGVAFRAGEDAENRLIVERWGEVRHGMLLSIESLKGFSRNRTSVRKGKYHGDRMDLYPLLDSAALRGEEGARSICVLPPVSRKGYFSISRAPSMKDA